MTRLTPSANMRTVSLTDLRSALPHILNQLRCAGPDATPIVLRRHYEPMAVLISFEQFDDYRALIAYRTYELHREDRPDKSEATDTEGVAPRTSRRSRRVTASATQREHVTPESSGSRT